MTDRPEPEPEPEPSDFTDDFTDDFTGDLGDHLFDDLQDDLADDGPRPSGPVVAVVGRPNVGKSTLVNRVLGRREAVVADVPGVTRDRVTYPAEWAGREFTLVDTGGWDSRAAGLAARVAAQAETAVAMADVALFVVDATTGPTTTDEGLVRLLRRSGRPVVLAANKVDDARGEADAAALWSLGLGEPHPVSALHGRGTGDLLDAVLAAAGSAPPRPAPVPGLRRVALVGRPNVGKSSLLNALAGGERVLVDSEAGTTRDAVDEVVEVDSRPWLFVDTAGIRRKARQAEGADFFAGLRTQAALERCEVAVVVVDGSQPLAEQDVRVVSMAVDAGRAVVLAVNKWDLLDEERRHYLERELETDLAHVTWAPRVNLSALSGRHLARLAPALDRALAGWETRVPTGRLNALVAEIAAAHPHPVRGGRQPRILYATQPAARPPRFLLFTTGFLEAGYRRFVERRLREAFGFEGTPIRLGMRVRERRPGERGRRA
jgi:GTP-binding protein